MEPLVSWNPADFFKWNLIFRWIYCGTSLCFEILSPYQLKEKMEIRNTPLKNNMEPKNQPIERENHLPNLHFGFHVNFPGCNLIFVFDSLLWAHGTETDRNFIAGTGRIGRIRPKWPTPRKINMEPENTPLEEENHLPNHHLQVLR